MATPQLKSKLVRVIMKKYFFLLILLPFMSGCTATAQTKWAKHMNKINNDKIETFSQLDSSNLAEKPRWLVATPQSKEGSYFVGMSTKRTEKRDARNESFNDALISFAQSCGLNVQYLSEHRDSSVGGNGGVIDTWSEGNTFAKMKAEMHLGNVTIKDRYSEKYSNFYGGSFMGHSYVVAALVHVPKAEMDLCRENRKKANAFIAKKAIQLKKLEQKNVLLETRLNKIENQNKRVAMSQVKQSVEFFKNSINSEKQITTSVKPKSIPKKIFSENAVVSTNVTITNNGSINRIPKKCHGSGADMSCIFENNISVQKNSSNSYCWVDGNAFYRNNKCKDFEVRYVGQVIPNEGEIHNSWNYGKIRVYYPHGNGVMFYPGTNNKYLVGKFKHGKIEDGNYYHSETNKYFKTIRKGVFIGMTNKISKKLRSIVTVSKNTNSNNWRKNLKLHSNSSDTILHKNTNNKEISYGKGTCTSPNKCEWVRGEISSDGISRSEYLSCAPEKWGVSETLIRCNKSFSDDTDNNVVVLENTENNELEPVFSSTNSNELVVKNNKNTGSVIKTNKGQVLTIYNRGTLTVSY